MGAASSRLLDAVVQLVRRVAALAPLLGAALLACAPRPASVSASGALLSIDRLYSLPNLIGTAPTAFAWSPDSRRLAFLWNDEGFNFHDVWVVDTEDPALAPVRWTRLQTAADDQIDDIDLDDRAALEARSRREQERGAVAVIWHPNGRQVLVSYRGDLWLATAGSPPRQLTSTPERESQASYSPDGRWLAYRVGGEIWLRDARRSDAVARQLTAVSGDSSQLSSYRWSPDGNRLALLSRDDSQVPVRSIPDYLTEEPQMTRIRRAYPGDPAPRPQLAVVTVADGKVRQIDVEGAPPDQILSYRWSPDGRALAFDTSDLYAKDRRIFIADMGRSSAAETVVREQDPGNVTNYFWRIEWAADSSRLYFLSDRQYDYHVYSVAAGGGEVSRHTRGEWAVAEMQALPDGLLLVANRGRPEERQLFKVTGDAEPVQLSRRAGTHSPTLSPDGRWAAVAFSSDQSPPELLLTRVHRSDDGTDSADNERVLTHSPIREFSLHRWVVPEYVTFSSHLDGTMLHGRLTLPPGFDPERSYPAILGSVYTDSVRNQWGGRTAHPTWGLDQYLAQQGYVLLNVDMRGSWGRGRAHRRGIRLDYGGIDIEDLESGVRYLESLGYVDMERIGLWGSSYGGLMTCMSLFRKPDLYAAGVAGAPATNVWHALTGQMAVMMRPEDQPDEYADSSPFLHASGLDDPLMIIHGMRDRIVLFKDSVELVQRLVLLGKDVDFVVLPDAGHGWDNEGLEQTRFAFEKLVAHFDRHLKPQLQ